MAKALIVKAAAAFVRFSDGTATLLLEGQPVPTHADPDDVKRLIEEDYLAEVEVATAAEPPPADMQVGDDPGDFSVAQVKAFLDSADEDEKARVLAAEAAGKARTSLTGTSGS